MAEARPVEDDDPMGLQEDLGDTAGIVVLTRHHVTVNEDDRAAMPTVAVMQSNPVHLQKRTLGRVTLFCAARHDMVCNRQGGERCRADGKGGADL